MKSPQKMDLQTSLRLSCSMLRDFGRLCNVDVTRDIEELSTRASEEGSFFLTRALLGFGRGLLRCLDQGRCSSESFAGFACVRNGGYPLFLKGFLERIFSSNGDVLPRGELDVQCFKAVYQIASSWYKHEVDCPEALVREQYKNFVLLDNSLDAESRPTVSENSLDVEKIIKYRTYRVLQRVLSKFSVNEDNFKPRHGSGSTSEGLNKPYQKWEFTYDRLSQDPDLFPYSTPFVARIWERKARGFREDDFDEFFPVATLTDVHKDSRGRRLISKEATKNMMYQQAMFEIFVEYLENSEFTGGRINFTDQSVNQRLAFASTTSSEGYWATIDFKDASDRVTWDNVRAVFPNHVVCHLEKARTEYYTIPAKYDEDICTELIGQVENVGVPSYYRKLRGVKSNPEQTFSVKGDGEKSRLVHKYNKHAPMGSALCFPVMATFIWACAVQRMLRESSFNIGKCVAEFTDEEIRHAAQLVYVYGDDLIVPSVVAPSIVADLESLGMLCNRDKSFIHAANGNVFRESCGVDALNGVDVTPIKFKSVFPASLDDIGSIESWVCYTNELASRGLLLSAVDAHSIVRQAVGERVIGLLHNTINPGAVCFSPLVSKLTGWHKTLDNPPKWDTELQCYVRPVLQSIPCQSFIPLTPKSEAVSLFRWLAEHIQPAPEYDAFRRVSAEKVFSYRKGLTYSEEYELVRSTNLANALPDSGGRKFVHNDGRITGWMEDDPKNCKYKISLREFPPLSDEYL